jgi:ferrous iron transport protein B
MTILDRSFLAFNNHTLLLGGEKQQKYMERKNKLIVGLIGNPNVGKSTLFNTLTGAKQHVGNWPGKTVEQKEGVVYYKNQEINIVDLPGAYSMNPYSEEELVSSQFINEKKADVIVQVIDAQNISRNLFLTTQLLEKHIKLVLVLNMNHLAQKKGIHIDHNLLGKQLGIPVVILDARKKDAFTHLMDAITQEMGSIQAYVKQPLQSAEDRYLYIEQLLRIVVRSEIQIDVISHHDLLDHVVMNRFIGIPLFLFLSYILFQSTFTLSEPVVSWIESMVEILSLHTEKAASAWGASQLFTSFLTEGVIGGVGGVLVFVPVIAILFTFVSILEDSGYMARIAYIMDGLMRKIGLHGKAFIPLILGFGCNVPGIMATRMLERKEDRLLSILINPFISCSARLPVYILFAGIFFPHHQGIIIFILYVIGISVAIGIGLLFRHILIKREPTPFIIELPPYRIPSLKGIGIQVGIRVWQFVQKAGTVILAFSIIIWFLATFPLGVTYGSQQSYFGSIGQTIAPILSPLGFGNWKAAIALLFGVVAKEVVVGTFSTLYSGIELEKALLHDFTPLTAFSFLVFTLLYVPCITVLAVIKNELHSWKWASFVAIYTMIIAWIVAFIVYRGGLLFGFV